MKGEKRKTCQSVWVSLLRCIAQPLQFHVNPEPNLNLLHPAGSVFVLLAVT